LVEHLSQVNIGVKCIRDVTNLPNKFV